MADHADVLIQNNYIEFLRGFRFSWTSIAQMLEISQSTLYRRLQEFDLSRDVYFTEISDRELDRIIKRIKIDHPHDGERLMSGHLVSMGILVQRTRLRGSIHRVDPANTAIRRSIAIRRRVYFAEGPNAVWHIDGNHKLIHWRLVVHGCIDGYSRTVIYLKCCSNNKAATVLSLFASSVLEYGVPCRVRTDLGGENTAVWQYMIDHHSTNSCVIAGSSVHNVRIERLWRDVFRSVSSVFYDTFQCLTAEGKLDPSNEADIYCLHYVFIPRINEALKEFVESWNNHPVSTARNLTPNQMFVRGAIDQDLELNLPDSSNPRHQLVPRSHVTLPRSTLTPCIRLRRLLNQINPLCRYLDGGKSVYQETVDIVGHHIGNGCSNCQA